MPKTYIQDVGSAEYVHPSSNPSNKNSRERNSIFHRKKKKKQIHDSQKTKNRWQIFFCIGSIISPTHYQIHYKSCQE